MAITLADFNKIWASTSPLTPYSFSESNYKQGWNFIGSTPPARQMWDFLQKNNDEKMQYLANNYLPLSGGTMTGAIVTSGYFAKSENDTSNVGFRGGKDGTSSSFILYGKNNANYPGCFVVSAVNENVFKQLIGKPDGTLIWGGNNVITSALTGNVLTATGSVTISDTSAHTLCSITSHNAGTWLIIGHADLATSEPSLNFNIGIAGYVSVRNINGNSGGGAVVAYIGNFAANAPMELYGNFTTTPSSKVIRGRLNAVQLA